MNGSKLILHCNFKIPFIIFYNIYINLQMHAYAKSEFVDAYTCTDIASLDIKWVNEYNLH